MPGPGCSDPVKGQSVNTQQTQQPEEIQTNEKQIEKQRRSWSSVAVAICKSTPKFVNEVISKVLGTTS